MQEEIVSGGISGAITDEFSDEAERHAKLYYAEIRKRKDDVDKIVKNTDGKYIRSQILQIKHYLFIDKHDLGGEIKRFEPSFCIALSWQRLSSKRKEDILSHDLLLLEHELYEMALIIRGYSQHKAHIEASRKYNYAGESYKYFERLRKIKNG